MDDIFKYIKDHEYFAIVDYYSYSLKEKCKKCSFKNIRNFKEIIYSERPSILLCLNCYDLYKKYIKENKEYKQLSFF